MKNQKSSPPSRIGSWWIPLFLLVLLAVLFWRSFLPGIVHFNNDGPLGAQAAAWLQFPQTITGSWYDLNSIGSNAGVFSPDLSVIIRWIVGPIGLSKFLPPISLWILGLGAWFLFRQLRFAPLACVLGALAAMLNSTFFSGACWGVSMQEVAVGMDFLALGLISANTQETPLLIRWSRLGLAGLCVGVNVMEAADIGAIFSLFIAAYAFFKPILEGTSEPVFKKALHGVVQTGLVALFAGFIAFQTVIGLVGSQIQGIAGTGQDTETKAQHWDWATQWSEPKVETLGLMVPGLFGYKMDTPKDMMPFLQDAYRGGVYWGGMGRDPVLDRYFDSGAQGTPPAAGFMRQTGGQNYLGTLVVLVLFWTIAQSFPRQNSPFSIGQRKVIWFWTAALVISLLLAWGRFAPFYALFYQLPYFSTIRNPAKFIMVLSWIVVILFGYGMHALSRRYLEVPTTGSRSISTQLVNWWSKAGAFDRKWTLACLGVFGASVLGWFVYGSKSSVLISYLQARGFPEPDFARQIVDFSIGQAGWWLFIFLAALVLLTLVLAGCFAGPRAKWGGLILGAFLILDLGRANLPYIIHWDYQRKYEIGSLNPVESFLREKPYEQRVAILPFETKQPMRAYDNYFGGSGVYRIEWTQHHFLYYNIQSLDIIQMSRMPADLKSYLEALSPHSQSDVALYARLWELTNTRYLLGAAGFLNILNQELDPGKNRFRIAQRFDIVAKPGIGQLSQLEDLTATASPDGELALFDFTGALPRAKLYGNWQVNTNDAANLKKLADLNFDPAQTLLISTPESGLPEVSTNANSGTVEFKSYAPKQIVFTANAAVPSVMLLNDKYDPNWRVTVDGKPAQLLRCNYIMRGVQVPPGQHAVEFDFSLPSKAVYVTLAAAIAGLILTGILMLWERRKPVVNPQ